MSDPLDTPEKIIAHLSRELDDARARIGNLNEDWRQARLDRDGAESRVRELLAERDTALQQCANGVAELDAKAKAAKAWEDLYNERNRLWRAAGDKLDAIGSILDRNGCDCECEHHWEEHGDECELCLACQISAVITRKASPEPPPFGHLSRANPDEDTFALITRTDEELALYCYRAVKHIPAGRASDLAELRAAYELGRADATPSAQEKT
jgi:hypothetical protein